MEKDGQSIIIIKKKKGHGHGHHGGGWKVAFADFMTAMMAFFLLMWVIASTTPAEKEAISGYFKDPGNNFVVGPGGADSSVVDMQETHKQSDPTDDQMQEPTDPGRNMSRDITKDERGAQSNTDEQGQGAKDSQELDKDVIAKAMEQQEKDQLEQLEKQLKAELNKDDSVFKELKDQIMIDFTALGLRIQIVDKEQRPMFDLGSPKLKSYSMDVLKALAPILDKVPNHISITGHTDSKPYGIGASYSNWELSADRANAARRALLAGKYPEAKVSTVQGMGSIAPYVADNPTADVNRRIAIIVLKQAVSDALSNGSNGINSSELMGSPDPQKIIDAEPPPAAYRKLK